MPSYKNKSLDFDPGNKLYSKLKNINSGNYKVSEDEILFLSEIYVHFSHLLCGYINCNSLDLNENCTKDIEKSSKIAKSISIIKKFEQKLIFSDHEEYINYHGEKDLIIKQYANKVVSLADHMNRK